MFSLFSGCYEYMTRKEELHVLIIGLDKAGKTTLLEKLKTLYTDYAGLDPSQILPTVGLNIARFEVNNTPMVLWDLGGQAPLRSIWEKYFAESHALLFVVDSSDADRIQEAKMVMDRALGNRELHGAPLLVLANKHDAPGAMAAVEIRELLGLGKFDTRPSDVQTCSALSGEGLKKAIDWLVDKAKHSHRADLIRRRVYVVPRAAKQPTFSCRASNSNHDDNGSFSPVPPPPTIARRHISAATFLALPAALFASNTLANPPAAEAVVKGYEPMPALQGKDYGKTRMTYSDYVTTDSGLQYQDLVQGTGATPSKGQTAVVDWSGVTIGYYGRPFEARNKPKGGAFTGDEKDFFRFKLGDPGVIPAFNEAVAGMKVGGIRRIIVPSEIGYPNNDYKKGKPSPTTFSGQRALGFVLENQGFIDKTLLFDIELLKVIE